MKKGILFFLLILCSLQISAQRKNFWLKGFVRDSSDLVKNAHIVNLNTGKGTFSNDIGNYRIVASIGDTLVFSSVQHEEMKKIITETIAFSKKLNVALQKKTYVLDEIIVKKHDLTGSLISDRKKVPKDSIAAIGKNISQSLMDLADKVTGFDEKTAEETSSIGKIHRETDPTRKFKGVGTGFSLGSGKRKKLKLQKITSNTFNSEKITNIIGEKFFINLKIPKERIYDFIDYCKKFNIRQLYEQDKLLDLLTLLEEKSVVYLETIK
ncbi:MAG: hypothetical protein JXR05_12540 [Flavobacteriaceae bacterium]